MLKSVRELADYADVSTQTIYRHLNKLDNKDKLVVKDSNGTQLLKDEAQALILEGLGLGLKASDDIDADEPVKEKEPASAQSDALTNDYIKTLKEQLTQKDKQLAQRDAQIKDLSNQLDNITVLFAQEKQEKQKLIEAQKDDETLTQDKPTLGQRLRDFF